MNSLEPTTSEPTGHERPFERQNATESAGSASVFGRHAKGHGSVEEACSVHVERNAMGVGDGGHGTGVLDGQRLRHRVGMGVLEGYEASDRLMGVRGIAERVVQLAQIPSAVRALGHLPDRGPHHDRMAGLLVRDHVGTRSGDRLLSPSQVPELRDEVRHRPAGDEEGGFLAQQLGGTYLQGVDRWVVAEDVVTQLGLVHGFPHGRGRVGDSVATEIDHSASFEQEPPRAVASVRRPVGLTRPGGWSVEYRARSSGRQAALGEASHGEATVSHRCPAPRRGYPGRLVGRVRAPRRRTGISDAHLLLFAVGTGSWCSGLTCQPVTLETAGSNPVEPAIMLLPAPSPPGRGSLFPAVQIGAATSR